MQSTNPNLSDGPSETTVPLVIDLDGTLCRTDTLHEVLLALVSSQPTVLLKLPGWIAAGRANFKAKLADLIVLSPDTLPFNEAVLDLLRNARAEGRPTALVSGADHRQVTAVAEALGLFDEAYGSAEGTNLTSTTKADFLTAHFGTKNFDYVADSRADLPVWTAARQAFTLGASQSLRRAAEAANPDTRHLDPPHAAYKDLLRALRPHQWSKNILMFLPVLAAHDLTKLWTVLLGFVAFCCAASAIYIVNDLLDLASDREHPRKRKRPFASGAVSAATGVKLSLGLLLVALTVSLIGTNWVFLAVLCTYLVITFIYSLWLKQKLIIDVITLAGLYTLRIIAGAVAAATVLSPWFLGFSMFLFLALATVKRQSELMDQLATGRKSLGRAYETEDLPILRGLALSSGIAAVMVMALYISTDTVQTLYDRPFLLWLICPILLYWVLRMIVKTHRGLMDDDPIVFATSDRVSMLLIVASGAIILSAAL